MLQTGQHLSYDDDDEEEEDDDAVAINDDNNDDEDDDDDADRVKTTTAHQDRTFILKRTIKGGSEGGT